MLMSDYLEAEWRPALGCTEPAAVAWAAASAASQAKGPVLSVRLVCDPRIYKNCYAVGLPHSDGRTGILWALAIGACLQRQDLALSSFEATTAEVLAQAESLLATSSVQVEVDAARTQLYIEVTVVREGGPGRARIEREHTNLSLVRLPEVSACKVGEGDLSSRPSITSIREYLAGLGIPETLALARSLSDHDRRLLREGALLNLEIAQFGRSLLPQNTLRVEARGLEGRVATYVKAGVTARMSGVSHKVMTLAGSGNKGITVSLPIWLWGRGTNCSEERIEEALALGCLITSATTHHLGTLSAACGSAIAAGAGITAGLVLLQGGSTREIGLAVSNVVGTLAGMICDGAKVGCAMKTVTGVEAAFNAADYAMIGEGIPASNGITGRDTETSLVYLGLVVTKGMASVDAEILRIMQGKLLESSSGALVPGLPSQNK